MMHPPTINIDDTTTTTPNVDDDNTTTTPNVDDHPTWTTAT